MITEVRDPRGAARGQTPVGRLRAALGRLAHVDRLDDLAERAVHGACEGCGLDRAVLFRVDGSRLVAQAAASADDPDWGERVLAEAAEHPLVLAPSVLETELVRRRTAMVVGDPQDVPGSYARLTGARGYVAAPVMPEGRVIAVLHGDCGPSGRAVDALDRDLLWTFAEGLGYALERAALRERLEAHGAQLQQMLHHGAETLRAACEAEVVLGATCQETVVALRPAATHHEAAAGLRSLLTPRELEVLELVAQGETNARIADRLVISQGTVKSHVKSLLRKLHVANRAEAVSRYHRLAAVAGGA